jgi:hypothetical protein
MRRTFIIAFLLVTASVVSAAGSLDQAAQVHAKTSATARAGSRPAGSKAASHKSADKTSRHTGQRARLARQGGAATRKTRYTPERASDAKGAPSSYAAGYRIGYESGRAAALKQVESDGAGAKTASQSPEAVQVRGESLLVHEPTAARRTTDEAGNGATPYRSRQAPGLSHAPAPGETIETETRETPPLREIASVPMSGAGMPGSLRGSLASLERQNARTDADGLERIEDDADLTNRIEHKLLVPLPASAALNVNPGLPEHNRYCRPWTASFLADLARAHQAAFHRPIEVNSAVRTVDYQKRLISTNGNAAAAEGDIVSPHLTGATVDIAKQGLSRREMAWMRRQLMGLQRAGKIDVEEEFEQACFHITVYKNYVPSKPVRGPGQPGAGQDSASRHKAGQQVQKPAGQLPADPPAGELPTQGR